MSKRWVHIRNFKDGNSNLLLNVSDGVSNQNTGGFVDGNTNPALDDYEYDENGNMVKDRNKGITSITYNYLNLPEQIVFENSNSIEYVYNALGVKLKKTVIEETATPEVRKEVDYLDGFQYAGEILNFFPTAEGYVRATPVGNIAPGAPPTGYAYSYVFNYTDHLGNVRLSYSMDHLTGKLKILEENHYYPFGLRHEVYVSGTKLDFSRNPGDGIEPEPGLPPLLDYVTRMEYQYKYNGKEWQDELGLGMYDMDMRQYDPAIARWVVMDPVIHHSVSPYSAFDNNPVFWADPSGAAPELGSVFEQSGMKVTSFAVQGTGTSIAAGGAEGESSSEESDESAKAAKDPGKPKTAIGRFFDKIGKGIKSIFGGGSKGNIIIDPSLLTTNEQYEHHYTNKNSDGAQTGDFINDYLYFEVSGEFNIGSYVDVEIEKGAGVDIGEKSTFGEFWYTKEAGAGEAHYGTATYKFHEKQSYTIGGSWLGGLTYNNTNGLNSFSVGVFGVGYTRTWGNETKPTNFVGLDTGVSFGIGIGGSLNILTGIKW